MGLCLSKKQHRRQEEHAAKKSSGKKDAAALATEAKRAPQAKPAPSRKPPPPRAEEPAADKRTVFVVKAAAAAAAAEVAAEANGEAASARRASPAAPVEEAKPAAAVSRVPVRTSSCTKEEVDAILIQCGRLSRSSSASGKAAAASGEEGRRRYSGSKRSYDFDRERRGAGGDEELDWERHGGGVSRPSPRRRTPERKRSASASHSGGGSGSRRVSRSPGRRGEAAPAAASSVGARQPGKMVSVPAREKGRAPSPVKAAPSAGKRYASPTLRSNSPARAAAVANENAGAQAAHGPSLSRSSSRKADHSPYRRNPMSELDENTLVSNHHAANNGKSQKKPIESVAAVSHKLGITKDKPEIVEEAVVAADTKAPSSRMNATHTMSIVADSSFNGRDGPGARSWRRSSRDFDLDGAAMASSDTRAPSSKINTTHSVNIVAETKAAGPPVGRPSSRRSSRDFDHDGINSIAFVNEAMASATKAPSSRMNATHTVSIVAESVANPRTGLAGRSSRRSSRDFDHNGNTYASLLLEDIQSYHQQNASDTAPAFSLPACVSKACSILEAVADLNSSSENRSFELEGSADDKGSVNRDTHVVESEVVVKDDLMEPSMHKYVSVRDIRRDTEPLESAGSNSFAGNPWTCSWEPNSVESTDRSWSASQQSNSDDVEHRSGGTVSDQSWQSKQETGGHQRVGSASDAQLWRSVLSARSDVRTVSASSSVA